MSKHLNTFSYSIVFNHKSKWCPFFVSTFKDMRSVIGKQITMVRFKCTTLWSIAQPFNCLTTYAYFVLGGCGKWKEIISLYP